LIFELLFVYNFIDILNMLSTLGSTLKRRSIEKVNPSLPHVTKNREKTAEGRTNHA